MIQYNRKLLLVSFPKALPCQHSRISQFLSNFLSGKWHVLTIISVLFLFLFVFVNDSFGQTVKEVEFNWNSPAIIWGKTADFIPCLEPFNLKVSNTPSGTTSVTVKVYNSDGPGYYDLVRGNLIGTYTASSQTNSMFTVFIPKGLAFHRFFYFQISAVQNSVSTTKQTLAYSTPLKSELSSLDFFGSLGTAVFFQTGLHHGEFNPAFSTGLKFRFKPISNNPNFNSRYALYPRLSRISFVFGTLINEVTYKTSDINALIFGLKPVLGFDFEFSENIGIFGGAVFGKQDTKSKLNSHQSVVAGALIGISFSMNVFNTFKNNIPASQNLPSLQNK